jgi:hypothetical protein
VISAASVAETGGGKVMWATGGPFTPPPLPPLQAARRLRTGATRSRERDIFILLGSCEPPLSPDPIRISKSADLGKRLGSSGSRVER